MSKWRSCTQKRRYVSQEGAEAVRDLRVARAGPSWQAVLAYACGHCGFWHLGHPPGSRGRRRYQ